MFEIDIMLGYCLPTHILIQVASSVHLFISLSVYCYLCLFMSL